MIHWVKRKIPKGFKLVVKRTARNLWQSLAYRMVRQKSYPIDKTNHIVFVCTGNICRSVFAEYFLRKKTNHGLKIESCGLDVTQAISSPIEAVNAGRSYGIDLSEHRSKGVMSCDLLNADLIIPMDYGHYRRLVADYPQYKMKIFLLRDFDAFPYSLICNIHDPFGLAQDEFECCFENIQRCLQQIAKLCY